MTTLYSRTFYFSGTATGGDQTPEFFCGSPSASASPYGHIGAEPWEIVSINIVGIGVIYFQIPSGLQYSQCGNSYSPDLMMTAANEPSKTHFFPDGLSFPFPAAGLSQPPHVDIHIAATGPYQGLYTVYYTKNAV